MVRDRWRKILKRLGLVSGLVVALLVAVGARPVFHLLKTAWNDANEKFESKPGTVNDASRLSETSVVETWKIPSDPDSAEKQLAMLLEQARAKHLKISIAGARHSMGGHTIARDGIVIDMLPFNRMELDTSRMVLHVQAGARWSEIIPFLNKAGYSVEIMQSNDDFSIGGSLSVNCHGWQFNRPPIDSSVETMRIMLANGEVVKCSRTERPELFSLVLGGYGLIGIILDADLHIVPNEKYRIERWSGPSSNYAKVLSKKAAESPDLVMAYGRLRVTREKFLEEVIINFFHRLPSAEPLVTELGEPKNGRLNRIVFRGSAGSDYGKQLRWDAEKRLDPFLSGDNFERNALLYEPVALFQNHSKTSTDILMECFVPPSEFEPFLEAMRKIIPKTHADLLNVTVRHVNRDTDSFLRYADKDTYSLVMLFDQSCDSQGESKMAEAAREIIAAVLKHDGRYYLPYRLHATPEQFAAAYPQAKDFFELKRKYDPDELFQNEFYRKYRN